MMGAWGRLAALAVALAAICVPAALGEVPSASPEPPPEASASAESRTAPHRLLVRFRQSADRPELLEEAETRIVDDLLMARTFELRTHPGQSVPAAVRSLEGERGVEFAEPVYRYELQDVPTDPLYSQQWHLPALRAPEAWDRSKGSSEVTIGIIDSGVDPGHPDLAGGLVDGYDFVWNDADPRDTDGHGTAVMGAAGARANNGMGVAGVDRLARLMPLQACTGTGCWSTHVIDAIVHARRAGVQILNMSFGSPGHGLGIKLAVQDSPEILFVAGAGNAGVNGDAYVPGFTPCAYSEELPNLICVAAHGRNGNLAQFSNWGTGVNISAPGEDILTTLPTYASTTGYGWVSGTSLASPIVAGAAGVLLAHRPESTPEEIRLALEHGDPTEEMTRSKLTSAGTKLDLVEALGYLDALDAPAPPVALDPPRIVGGARVRHQLRSWRGRWQGRISDFSYQWQRAAAGGFVDIPGATRPAYTPSAGDVGSSLRVEITASDAAGRQATAVSEPTDMTESNPGAMRLLSEESWASVDGVSTSEGIREVEVVGDMNADGYTDVAITRGEAEWYDPGTTVVLGPVGPHTDLAAPPAGRSFEIHTAGWLPNGTDVFIDSVGDFDRDGFDDLLVTETNPEHSWVVFGESNPTDLDLDEPGSRALEVSYQVDVALPAARSSGIGDVDGDGFDDVALNALDVTYGPNGLEEAVHRVHVLYGGTSRGDVLVGETAAGHRSSVIEGYAEFPYGSVYPAGDSNGDGYDDIAISIADDAFAEDSNYSANVTVLYGGPDGPAPRMRPLAEGAGWMATITNEFINESGVSTGDVDGDGNDDLVVGWAGSPSPARSWVLWGGPSHGDVDVRALAPSEGFAVYGGPYMSVYETAVGDLNGDGSAETAFGSPSAAGLGRGLPGAVTAVRDGYRTSNVQAYEIPAADGLNIAGEENRDSAASELETGDINGDGTEELLVVSSRADPQGRNEAGRLDILSWSSRAFEPQKPPVARLSAPTRITGGSAVLDASASSDPDGSITRYAWDLDGDGDFETAGGQQAVLQTTKATHEVAVRVVDDEGAFGHAVATVTVGPDPVPPPGPPGGGPGGSSPPAGRPSNDFGFAGGAFRHPRLNHLYLRVGVPGPGYLFLGGRGIKPYGRRAETAGKFELSINARSRLKSKLLSGKAVRSTLEVTFAPDGGSARMRTKEVTLKIRERS